MRPCTALLGVHQHQGARGRPGRGVHGAYRNWQAWDRAGHDWKGGGSRIGPHTCATRSCGPFANKVLESYTLGLPLVLFFAVAGANRHGQVEGISFPLYFMGAMAAYGAMSGPRSSPGRRVALEPVQGLDPPAAYHAPSGPHLLRGRSENAYLVALVSLGALFLAGPHRFRRGAHDGRTMAGTGGTAAHRARSYLGRARRRPRPPAGPRFPDPAVGGLMVGFALLGGAYGPLFTDGAMLSVVKLLPSYWLVRASRGWRWVAAGVAGGSLGCRRRLDCGPTSVVALLAYRRDTARV